MTTNEREIAIREGHKIHAETSYFTPRPQLDFENARHVFCEGFDRGYIAATTEANKRIAELDSEVAELKVDINEYIKISGIQASEITELQADNNRLREALESCKSALVEVYNDDSVPKDLREIADESHVLAKQALSATPAESLQAHDNEVIEKCAKVCDKWIGLETVAEVIRALKEVK